VKMDAVMAGYAFTDPQNPQGRRGFRGIATANSRAQLGSAIR